MRVLPTAGDFRIASKDIQGTVGLVPTMGYLHEGHLALIREARNNNDTLAVSIFVNPTQFGPKEDLADYPRDFDRDLAMLEAEGADLVFTPSAEDMYSNGFDTWVSLGGLAHRLEGEYRPNHFPGVATVVIKLFNVVKPHRAYFGQKDAQQLAVIKRLVADLNFDIEIVAVPTVREPDGLAMSSRNVYLTPKQRKAAPVIYHALSHVWNLWAEGERGAERLRKVMRKMLKQERLVKKIDYVSVADPVSFEDLEIVEESAIALAAVRIGKARLTDNVVLSSG